MNAVENLKAWVHWAKIEQEPNEDKIEMAHAIEKLIAVVEAAKQYVEANLNYSGQWDLHDALKALEEK